MRTEFSKIQIKCAFFNWIDMLMPNRQQYLAIDMGESEDEQKATILKFWRVFAEMLLDVEEVE